MNHDEQPSRYDPMKERGGEGYHYLIPRDVAENEEQVTPKRRFSSVSQSVGFM